MLAAAANPAVVGIVVLMLTTSDRPLARAGAFVIGFAAVLVAAGIAGLILFSGSRETVGPGGRPPNQSRLLERVGPDAFFAVGAIFMITNASALAAYAPLLREIAIADVTRFQRGLALAISDLVILMPIAAPIVIRLLAPRSSQRILSALRSRLDRYGSVIAIAVFGAIGIFLLIRGITRV
jgi:hypothetical protein